MSKISSSAASVAYMIYVKYVEIEQVWRQGEVNDEYFDGCQSEEFEPAKAIVVAESKDFKDEQNDQSGTEFPSTPKEIVEHAFFEVFFVILAHVGQVCQ